MSEIVVDGSNALLGRLASYVAKQALLGKKIVVVNCKYVVISGNSKMVASEYMTLRKKGGSALNGPHFPKSPERIVKRTIRGMLPYKQGRGERAFDLVMCYNEVPAEYADVKKIKSGKEKNIRVSTLQEIVKYI